MVFWVQFDGLWSPPMSTSLRISDAAVLGLHTAVLLAANPGRPLSTSAVSAELQVSEAHLSKVLQRLAKAGLVGSVRGPKGGYILRRPGEEIALLEVFEALEGPFPTGECLLPSRICGNGANCILGSLIHTINTQMREYLGETTLAAMTRVYKG